MNVIAAPLAVTRFKMAKRVAAHKPRMQSP